MRTSLVALSLIAAAGMGLGLRIASRALADQDKSQPTSHPAQSPAPAAAPTPAPAPAPGAAQPAPAAKPAAKPAGGAGFPDLIAGLKATPGCLGVETARTQSGKNVIFAWFKDKQSCLEWYDSDMHKNVMNSFFPKRPAHEALQDIPEDVGPIMAIASITMGEPPKADGAPPTFAQIAIELYAPLPGGIALGGRFAPDSLEVKGMKIVGKP